MRVFASSILESVSTIRDLDLPMLDFLSTMRVFTNAIRDS